MAELRAALGSVSDKELAASDARVLDGFVDDRKSEFDPVMDELGKQLDAVQDSLKDSLEDKMSLVQADFVSRIDTAVEELRRSNEASAAAKAQADAALSAAAAGLAPAELPNGALVVVMGATTQLGGCVLRTIGRGDEGVSSSWRLRAIVPAGATLYADDKVERVTYAPFAPTALSKSLAGAAAVVLVMAASGGAGGIEAEAVPKICQALDAKALRRIVMLSTHGVERTDKIPFNLKNMFGQLDKERSSEQELILHARKACPSFTIVRTGKLVDAQPPPLPLPTASLPMMGLRAELQPGDALGGELGVDAAAAVVVQSLARGEAVNASFSIGAWEPAGGKDASSYLLGDAAWWDDQWLKLVGPEVYRRPLSCLPHEETARWLQEWAREFLRPGKQLTTPIAVQDSDDGVLVRFLTRASGYADFDADETAEDAWAEAKSAAGEPDGALLLVSEARPTPRVRVMRTEMIDGVSVKEMSETALLAKLEKDLSALEQEKSKNGE